MTEQFDPRVDPTREFSEVLDDLETLLKNGDVAQELAERGVNTSIALLVVAGLRSYIAGRKEDAAEDLETAFEEIRGRIALMEASKKDREKGSNGHGNGSS